MAYVTTSYFTKAGKAVFYLLWVPGFAGVLLLLAFDAGDTWWSATGIGWLLAQLLVFVVSAVVAKIVDYNMYMRKVRALLNQHPEWKELGLSKAAIETHMRNLWLEERSGDDF